MTRWLRLPLSEALGNRVPEPNLVSTGVPPAWLLEERLSAPARALGLLLAVHAQKVDEPMLTLADLARELPGTPDQVRDALIELAATGWIEVVSP